MKKLYSAVNLRNIYLNVQRLFWIIIEALKYTAFDCY